MDHRITGLSPEPFRHLSGLDDAALARHGAQRLAVDQPHAFPDRVELRDAAPGETVLLLNYAHQPADTPYRSAHAIFVREGAAHAYGEVNAIPDVMLRRTLSLRAFDADHRMVDTDLVEGREAQSLIDRLLRDPRTAYLHAHYARRGCFAATIRRA